jgi:hypothetical protein
MKIEIYDPPMCCPSGVCGPSVDPKLVKSLAPLPVSDPVLAGRRAQERRYIEEVAKQSGRTYLIPWQADPDLTAC